MLPPINHSGSLDGFYPLDLPLDKAKDLLHGLHKALGNNNCENKFLQKHTELVDFVQSSSQTKTREAAIIEVNEDILWAWRNPDMSQHTDTCPYLQQLRARMAQPEATPQRDHKVPSASSSSCRSTIIPSESQPQAPPSFSDSETFFQVRPKSPSPSESLSSTPLPPPPSPATTVTPASSRPSKFTTPSTSLNSTPFPNPPPSLRSLPQEEESNHFPPRANPPNPSPHRHRRSPVESLPNFTQNQIPTPTEQRPSSSPSQHGTGQGNNPQVNKPNHSQESLPIQQPQPAASGDENRSHQSKRNDSQTDQPNKRNKSRYPFHEWGHQTHQTIPNKSQQPSSSSPQNPSDLFEAQGPHAGQYYDYFSSPSRTWRPHAPRPVKQEEGTERQRQSSWFPSPQAPFVHKSRKGDTPEVFYGWYPKKSKSGKGAMGSHHTKATGRAGSPSFDGTPSTSYNGEGDGKQGEKRNAERRRYGRRDGGIVGEDDGETRPGRHRASQESSTKDREVQGALRHQTLREEENERREEERETRKLIERVDSLPSKFPVYLGSPFDQFKYAARRIKLERPYWVTERSITLYPKDENDGLFYRVGDTRDENLQETVRATLTISNPKNDKNPQNVTIYKWFTAYFEQERFGTISPRNKYFASAYKDRENWIFPYYPVIKFQCRTILERESGETFYVDDTAWKNLTLGNFWWTPLGQTHFMHASHLKLTDTRPLRPTDTEPSPGQWKVRMELRAKIYPSLDHHSEKK